MESNLSKNIKFTRVLNFVAAGQAEQKSTMVDMQGYDGVLFVLLLDTVVATATVLLQALQNTTNTIGTATAITGSSQTLTSPASNGVMLCDVFRPTQEFVAADVQIGVANVTIDGILAIQYKAKKAPTIQDVTTILGATLVAN